MADGTVGVLIIDTPLCVACLVMKTETHAGARRRGKLAVPWICGR